jgi:hypothetical protein
MFRPLNQNDPESIRYRILTRNAINPNSSALKLAKINKEYRFVNSSDQDPPIFADINKTNGNDTTIEFRYSIPTVFKIGQLQSEYSPGIITVGIQSETFFVVGIQSHCVRV